MCGIHSVLQLGEGTQRITGIHKRSTYMCGFHSVLKLGEGTQRITGIHLHEHEEKPFIVVLCHQQEKIV
jgi:hypothetical protein